MERRLVQRLEHLPHGLLHQAPFHAFKDGDTYLLDRYSISYSPSASLFSSLLSSSPSRANGSLVLGIPDDQAPAIADEIEVVRVGDAQSMLFHR